MLFFDYVAFRIISEGDIRIRAIEEDNSKQ